MPEPLIETLNDCTEYRQTLLARPPRIVHGTVLLSVTLLGVAVGWSALTSANLVVRVPGRIRPMTSPQQVMVALGSEVRTAAEGRVVAVHVRPGDEVRRGQVLIQLDTEGLDNEIAKRRQTIRSGEDEVAELTELSRLAGEQHAAARAKTEAELNQARAEAAQTKDRQAVDVRLAKIEHRQAEDEFSRIRQLADRNAVGDSERVKAELRLQEAAAKVAKAELAVSDGKVEVLTRSLAQLDTDATVKGKELDQKRRTRESEVAAARSDLANLELQRNQASLRAPCDGVVTTGEVKVGDLLDRTKPVLEIAAQGKFRFEGTVPSNEVGLLRVGLPVQIKLDSFDYQRYGTLTGTVSFLAPDSQSGDEKKAVQHLVRIDVDAEEIGRGEWHGIVKLGMAGKAEIVTGRESLLSLLTKQVRQSISLN